MALTTCDARDHAGRAAFLRLGPVDVVVRSDLAGIREGLAEIHGDSERHVCEPVDPIRIEVRKSGHGGLWRSRYSVWGDGTELFPDCRPREVLPCADWAINHRVVARCRQYLQLHAATLARSGMGFVFAGPSGSGKSTLAAGLLARGWELLSDEILLLDPVRFLAQPLPKALCVKAGSFPLVRELGLPLWTNRLCEKGGKGCVGYIPVRRERGDGEPVARPVGVVCLTSHVAGSTPRAEPVPPAEAAFELSRLVFNREDFGLRTTSLIAHIVRAAACYRLTTSSLPATCDLIESLRSPA